MFLPETVRRWRTGRRRQSGDLAVTRTLVALAAGDTGDARREAARARRLLGDTPQVLLLAAEAGRLSGRESEAEAAFRALAEREESAFLGLRGLLRQAMARKDWEQAAVLARQAEAAHPGAAWLRGERSQLAMRVGSWSEALALADPDAPKAALATAAAQAETDPTHGLRLAKQAWTEDPSLAPAALAYARRLRDAGRESRAQDVLRKTWSAAPHPDIGEMALAPHTDPLARVQEAKRLAQENPDHPETHLLLAQASLGAGLIGEARHQAEAARAAGLNDRRLWMLLADLEETERGRLRGGPRGPARCAARRGRRGSGSGLALLRLRIGAGCLACCLPRLRHAGKPRLDSLPQARRDHALHGGRVGRDSELRGGQRAPCRLRQDLVGEKQPSRCVISASCVRRTKHFSPSFRCSRLRTTSLMALSGLRPPNLPADGSWPASGCIAQPIAMKTTTNAVWIGLFTGAAPRHVGTRLVSHVERLTAVSHVTDSACWPERLRPALNAAA